MYKNNTLFPDYKPFYRLLKVDDEGNILIFKNKEFGWDSKKEELYLKGKIGFKVFSKTGKFIKSFLFDSKSKEGEIFSHENLWIKSNFVYYFDQSEEGVLRRAKIEYNN